MQRLERCLQILIAAMAVLGTTMMSMGGMLPFMGPLMCVVAVSGVVFTDTLKWFYLHRFVVNFIAIVAMVLTLTDFLDYDSTGQLLLIAYLLISWEAVMLFQRKTARVYWCIAVLSLLQVVVASVLNSGPTFGLLILVYVVIGFFALVLFFLAREFHRVEERRRAAARSRAALVAVGEQEQSAVISRLPLRRLLRSTSLLGLISLLFSVVFFYGAPRINGGWHNNQKGPKAETGFTTDVSLEEMGDILQSKQQVMRISFSNYRIPDQECPIFSSPYIHGAVLTQYRNGRWHVSNSSISRRLRPIHRRLMGENPSQDFLKMSVTLEPATSATLFSTLPCYRIAPSEFEFGFHDYRQQLTRNPDPDEGIKTRYSLITTSFQRGIQNSIRPHWSVVEGRLSPVLEGDARKECLKFNPIEFPQLTLLARKIVGDATDDYDRAQRLNAHFLESDDYKYSLQFSQVERDASVDPIEDFIANHKRGHCEYFASALALMLRSQGIPSRLAVGFHGGTRNDLSGDIRILQSDAHAWVEAYMPREFIPDSARIAMGGSRGGGWLRLDPTPAGDDDSSARNRLDDVLDYAQLLWTDFVLEMNPTKQRETLEQAIGTETMKLGLLTRVRNGTRQVIQASKSWVGGDWFSWRAGVLASFVCLVVVAVGRIVYPLVVLLKRLSWKGKTRTSTPIGFYSRLEKLLKKLSLVRKPAQTQQEFARLAAEELRARGLAAVAEIPMQLTNLFYSVRFGGAGQATPEDCAPVVDSALNQLAAAIESHRTAKR